MENGCVKEKSAFYEIKIERLSKGENRYQKTRDRKGSENLRKE